MTPLQYAQCYWNLKVLVDSSGHESRTVNIKNYRLVSMSSQGGPVLPPGKPLSIEKDKLLSKAKEDLSKNQSVSGEVLRAGDSRRVSFSIMDWGLLGRVILNPFIGKGSPEEIQAVLQLAVRYGLADKDALQQYCDDTFIGLDCNGFVGNYVRDIQPDSLWHNRHEGISGSTKIGELVGHHYLSSPAEMTFEGTFMFGMVGAAGKIVDTSNPPGHIGLTEPFTLTNNFVAQMSPVMARPAAGFSPRLDPLSGMLTVATSALPLLPAVRVVESTGHNLNGLVTSIYVIVGAKHGVFTLQRGLGMGSLRVRFRRVHTA